MEVFALRFFGYGITRFSLDIRIYWLVFTGCRTMFFRTLDFNWIVKDWILRFFRIFWIYGVLRIFRF
jgi:hypothetical protein